MDNNCSTFILIYIIWNIFIISGTAYIVFWKNHSAWWFLLAVLLLAFPLSCKNTLPTNKNNYSPNEHKNCQIIHQK
ncbi:hypothetical protein QLL95_gp0991 [Cotonvirus japonicus]|uniref:Uncharacterized protein n=1 Tax=Cotonvirus japonicus TaxID=2811091 RepID=A0ABM7NSJ0_9VIRU|nr:hypothetical protein QLL95_gp0991 [Cotonvirus japonicus]BCS83132.1 hypothetical protein [Cotonvirus japonicus]